MAHWKLLLCKFIYFITTEHLALKLQHNVKKVGFFTEGIPSAEKIALGGIANN
jgi:hypothetical protein